MALFGLTLTVMNTPKHGQLWSIVSSGTLNPSIPYHTSLVNIILHFRGRTTSHNGHRACAHASERSFA